jgi:hypothetical protein
MHMDAMISLVWSVRLESQHRIALICCHADHYLQVSLDS